MNNGIAQVLDRKEQVRLDGESVLEVRRKGWDTILQAGEAITASGRIVEVTGTYAMGQGLSIYNLTDRVWIYDWKWTNR